MAGQVEVSRPQGSWAGRALKLGLGLAISALFLYATLATVPFGKVVDALGGARPEWISAALGFVALAYLVKIQRWTAMLRSLGAKVDMRDTATPFLGGVAFNNVLPFRAGDVIRVVAFQRFTGVPASGQVGTLLLERLLDLFVLMTILFAAVTLWRIDVLDEALLAGLQLAALAVAIAILLFILAPASIRIVVRWAEPRVPKLRPAGEALLRLSDAVHTLSRPAFLAKVTGLSFVAWIADGGAYFAIGHALGVAASPEAALLAVSVGTLSTIIPSAPGYVGTFHFFTARVVSAFGANPVGAAAYAILIHALLWVATTASGLLLLAASALGPGRSRVAPAGAPE
jgi:uncharacterized protein (TIRG00374 family)